MFGAILLNDRIDDVGPKACLFVFSAGGGTKSSCTQAQCSFGQTLAFELKDCRVVSQQARA